MINNYIIHISICSMRWMKCAGVVGLLRSLQSKVCVPVQHHENSFTVKAHKENQLQPH